ncbi:AAA-domain-containing protein [Panus rudis PR-1116 ss-1]|nr:AAA-domain-containing protein [Panus rudis PR-1116 ss-1]
MRSQFLVRRTRSLLKTPSISSQRALLSSTRPRKFPRKPPSATSATSSHLTEHAPASIALAHSNPPPSADSPDTPPDAEVGTQDAARPPESSEPFSEETEKPKRKTRTSVKDASDIPPEIPRGLDILWTPDSNSTPEAASSSPPDPALPPPEIMHEVMTNLFVTLHPQTQHRAAYSTSFGPMVEPTLALYCPIEGGDYVLDATVREMGRQANADVIVLDSVQLAAGGSGHFGSAASVFKPPQNPLHFEPISSQSQPKRSEEDEDEDDDYYRPSSQQLTLHVMTPAPSRSSRTQTLLAQKKGPSTMSKMKALFDELINISPPVPDGSTDAPARRPRIIYIRDYPTIAPSSSTWYPALLQSVRQRRQGPIARTTSPVLNPTTIVFGVTPPIVPVPSKAPAPRRSGLMAFMQSRQSPPREAKPIRVDFTESEDANKAREKRLADRLRRWHKGDPSLFDEVPKLSPSREGTERNPSNEAPEIVVLGGGDSLPGMALPQLAQSLAGRMGKSSEQPEPDSGTSAPFFRTTVIVPSVRSPDKEKECRMRRRREINELVTRMGVASVGGVLEKLDLSHLEQLIGKASELGTVLKQVWEDWGEKLEYWSDVRQMADRAVGGVLAKQNASGKPTLEPTLLTWADIFAARSAYNQLKDSRKAWIKQSVDKAFQEEEKEEDAEREDKKEKKVDEVVEQLKREAEEDNMDPYQQRLMRCIVDPVNLRTTFDQVYLPPHTIDSVRTIVSLPLLHPSAFQTGVLKEHGMTGCLLFGPPGTGKTLVVRALAKEAGCRMLIIQPSDVMDMYYGEAEKLVRAAFALARRLAPCVVFIDEIDALFGARERGGGDYAHRGTITEFMQEMDGLRSSKEDNVIVIGATNRPFDLDDAVLRRLPRRILVDLPGEREREEILKILLRDEKLAPDVDLKVLAKKTESFSGSDLKHLCVAAALDAVKERVAVPWRSPPDTVEADVTGTAQIEQSSVSPEASPASSTSIPPTHVSSPTESYTSGSATATIICSAQSAENITSSGPPDIPLKAGSTAVLKPTEQLTAREQSNSSTPSTASPPLETKHSLPPPPPRMLHWRNFEVALKEITPSSSEALASFNDLRKWNEEFGEGRKGRKKHVWGKDKFGFTGKPLEGEDELKISKSKDS